MTENKESTNGSKTGKAVEKASKKSKLAASTKKSSFVPFAHKWLASSLKGHSSRVVSMDFSPNGKYLVTASDGENIFSTNFSASLHRSLYFKGVQMSIWTKAYVCLWSVCVCVHACGYPCITVFIVNQEDWSLECLTLKKKGFNYNYVSGLAVTFNIYVYCRSSDDAVEHERVFSKRAQVKCFAVSHCLILEWSNFILTILKKAW